jgi:hypothetical protein
MKTIWQLTLTISFCTLLYAGETNSLSSSLPTAVTPTLSDTVESASSSAITLDQEAGENRKTTATIYSVFVPGSGQTMLGSPYKGVGFTIAAFGSVLTALISQNNFIASNERLDALEFQYKNSTTWVSSDVIYRSMIETHEKMLKYKKQRNTFILISALVWSANILDVVFNTEDEGDVLFSSVSISAVPLASNGVHPQPTVTLSLRLP